jgi:hypothetical protein
LCTPGARFGSERAILALVALSASLRNVIWDATYVDDSRAKTTNPPQSELQEVFGCDSVTIRGQHEIDGVAFRIESPIQIGPFARIPDVCFIYSPQPVRAREDGLHALVQNRSLP